MLAGAEPVVRAEAAAAHAHAPDFARPLVAILGLPFDALTLAEAVERVRADALAGRRCFVSTPNLNFAITARRDAAFRRSVLHSDLSLVDGMPLVWTARLLGARVPERVSGADLFEALQAHAGAPLAVYVFGGPEGAARAACERINARGGGLRCVGFDAGGFGSIAELSGDERIARINASGAQFVVVALGAAKGQAWIEHNADRLVAPVLSHLGAVVNFAAGALARAPRWMQRTGLEWLWRIKEEPALWRRYARDGILAAGLLLGCVLPEAAGVSLRRWRRARAPQRLDVTAAADGTTIALHGDWRGDELVQLRRALADAAHSRAPLTIDLRHAQSLGARALALLLVADGWCRDRGGFGVVGARANVARSIRRQLAGEWL